MKIDSLHRERMGLSPSSGARLLRDGAASMARRCLSNALRDGPLLLLCLDRRHRHRSDTASDLLIPSFTG